MTRERDARTVAWYRTPLTREQMRELNQRSDWKGLLQTLGHLSLIALIGILAWQVQDRIYLLLPVLLAYGTVYIFLLNATHELSHNSVFKTRLLNHFFLRLFCFIGWRSHLHFWTSHAEHHKYTLHPPDDLEVVLPAKLTLKNAQDNRAHKAILLEAFQLPALHILMTSILAATKAFATAAGKLRETLKEEGKLSQDDIAIAIDTQIGLPHIKKH